MSLTVIGIRAAESRDKPYKLTDGQGLYLLVNPTGSKLWRYDYRFEGKRKTLAFGAFSAVSLADARDKRDDARRALREGRDPAIDVHPNDPPPTPPVADPFEEVARTWFAAKTAGWVSSYSSRIMSRLEGDIFPALGKRPVSAIEPPELLQAIRAIENRGAIELAKRVKNYCGEVFRFAIAEGKATRDPSADISSALRAPKPKKRRAALKAADLPKFLAQLGDYDGETQTRLALRLTMLTVVRTNEIRFAEWSEFENLDGPEPLWRIPAERMKMKSEHLVPLSRQTVTVLQNIRALRTKGKLLFPADTRSGAMSENTMLYAMYRMGYRSRATVHGFRGTFSTIANESGKFDSDWIERCLAHVEQNEVRAAYNSARYLPQRRALLQWWADLLDAEEALGRMLG